MSPSRNDRFDLFAGRSLRRWLSMLLTISVIPFGAASVWIYGAFTPVQYAIAVAGVALSLWMEFLADDRERARGLVKAVGGVGLLAIAAQTQFLGSQAGPVLTGAMGVWLSLDGVQSFRYGAPDGDRTVETGRERGDPLAGGILNRLDDGPRTRRELRDALDADGADLDRSLDRLRDRGAVEKAGSAYRVSARGPPGLVDGLRRDVGDLLERAARPITVEFEATGEAEEFDRSAPKSDGLESAENEVSGGEQRRERAGERVAERE